MAVIDDAQGKRSSGELAAADAANQTFDGKRNTGKPPLWVRLAWLPIPLLVAIMAVFAATPGDIHTSPRLLLALNFAFSTVASLFVAYLVGRSFLTRGAPGLLMLGCGVVLWGSAGAGAVAISRGNINVNLTIFAWATCLAALCHLTGISLSLRSTRALHPAGIWLALGYVVSLIALGLVSILALDGVFPIFFVPGQGSTWVRQLVLGSACAIFALAAIMLRTINRKSLSSFSYWYSYALGLIAVGLFGTVLASSFSSVLFWAGRAGSWLGGVYMLIAAIASVRESHVWGISLEVALHESEERFRLLVDQTKDHAIFMLDPEGRVISWNSGAQSIKGYTESEIIGRHMSCFYVHEDIEQGKPERLLRVAAEHGFVEDEGWRVRKDGSRFWAEVTLSALRDDSGRLRGFSKVTRDITEHRKAEQRIAHLASFPELNASPVLEMDLQGKITYANPAAKMRFPDIAEIGMKHPVLKEWSSVTAALGTDVQQQVVRREVEADRAVFHQTFHYLPNAETVRVYFADITERKRAEEQLQKLNRTLTALSNCNQALMHATDEPALLQQVCRIVTEDCGYAMVWIGYAENDENKTVRPVAYSGYEEGYLETMRLTWADNERGRGPTGTAIRTGQPSTCRNMLTDPAFTPWRAEAIKRGYASSLVIPLKEGDKVFGAITIYSREPDTFTEGEVNLLTELAGDLTYGINTLRVRAARAQAEEALRESEDRLRVALDSARFGTFDFPNPPTGALIWDAQMKQIWGVPPGEQPDYAHALERVHPEDREQLNQIVFASLAPDANGDYEAEYRLIWPDGTTRWTSAKGRVYFQGEGQQRQAVRMVGVQRDITEGKRAEEALRASEERWATTLRSIGDAVISTCAQGKVIFMNEVAEKLTGWPLSEAQGRDLDDVFNIVNEVTRSKPENPVAKVVRLGQVVGLANHTALISHNGTELPIEDSGAPIRDKEGQVTGVVLVFHDVSEKRRVEKALRDSERLATTGRLASTLAHEIHNPLDTVGSLLYLIDRAPDVPQTLRQHVAMATDELNRVTQMTRHMLSFQRESKKPVPIKIGEVLDNVIALYERKIESAGIELRTQVDFGEEFLGLPGELRQVFANLVGNAIEAIGQGGKITLHAYASREWRQGRRGLRVTVADNGPGIPTEVRDKIFDPFFTTKGESGTGLGLWITSSIIEKNDGVLRLRAVTRDGRSGTCFSVFFPFPT